MEENKKGPAMLDLVITETKTLERLVTDFLCGMLGLDVRKSRALGYGSSSISVDEKLSILKELRTVDEALYRDISTVQEMRNRLAREWQVVDLMFYQGQLSAELRKRLEVLFEQRANEGTLAFLDALKRINATLHPQSWRALAVIICKQISDQPG